MLSTAELFLHLPCISGLLWIRGYDTLSPILPCVLFWVHISLRWQEIQATVHCHDWAGINRLDNHLISMDLSILIWKGKEWCFPIHFWIFFSLAVVPGGWKTELWIGKIKIKFTVIWKRSKKGREKHQWKLANAV